MPSLEMKRMKKIPKSCIYSDCYPIFLRDMLNLRPFELENRYLHCGDIVN